MENVNYLNQKQRLAALILNFIILYVIYFNLSGAFIPTGNLKDLWFVSILSYWLLVLIGSPFFQPPKDTFGNSLSALLLLITTSLNDVTLYKDALDAFRWFCIFLTALTIILAIVAICFAHSDEKENSVKYKISKISYNLCNSLGKGEITFSFPILISVVGSYASEPAALMQLTFLWLVIAFIRPIELLIKVYLIAASLTLLNEKHKRVGTIVRIDDPNIIRLNLLPSHKWKAGNLHQARLYGGEQAFILPLFSHLQGNERIGTGLIHSSRPTTPLQGIDEESCGVYEAFDPSAYAHLIQSMSGRASDVELVGFVVENSTISEIHFEASQEYPLEEGMVVFVNEANKDIYYQILDAKTSEESFSQNPRGTHIVKAAQLGILEGSKSFKKFPWLPSMNKPVFRAQVSHAPQTTNVGEVEIGKVPSSDIAINASLKDLIEYHTAILGITGTGKTELALDIIKAATRNNTKVICVDITGEYKKRLSGIAAETLSITPARYGELTAALAAVETGAYGAKTEKAALATLLNTHIKPEVAINIANFIADANKKIGFIELTEIANSKEMLTVIELYLAVIMDWARSSWAANNNTPARTIMIALEEAHTIIPETFGSSYNHETKVTVDRIGQIALQGRKYGVGLLIISQRTALVSKTILSQCNTYLTHALIDQTSLGYLANVYSPEHMKVIPNLRFLELLAFGKAIPSERPLLLKRDFVPPAQATTNAPTQGAGGALPPAGTGNP